MALVSIIVPSYNAEKYLERCMTSILCQTHSNIELILVDDGSIDDSDRIYNEYALKDSRVKIVRQDNGGVSRARNRGIDESQGEWIMFVDADDWIEPDTVDILLRRVEADFSDVGIYGFLFEDGYKQTRYHIYEGRCLPATLFIKENITGMDGLICSPCNKIYSKKLVAKNKIYFLEDIKFGEDFIFNTRVLSVAGRISCMDIPLYHYDRSVENSGVKKFYAEYDKYIHQMESALKKLFRNLNINGEETAFYESFITARWSYATTMCIESAISFQEKVQVLYKWYNKIDETILDYARKQADDFALFADVIARQGNSVSSVEATLKLIINKYKKTDKLNKIKYMIKKVITK